MKKTLFEGRLDNTVDPCTIGIGETVEIRNRMGVHVDLGDVAASTPFGVSLKNGNFYNRDLYLFAVIEQEQPNVIGYQLLSSPDERVLEKLKEFGENIPVFEAENLDDNSTGDKDKDKKENSKFDINSKSKEKNDEPLANTDSSIDINSLPDDIKTAVISTTQMNENQLNAVLSEIGDSAIKALKRINIKDPEIYKVVGEIQDYIEHILTTPIKSNSKKK
jgi:hypothetical protein